MIKKFVILAVAAAAVTALAASLAQGEAGKQWKDKNVNLAANVQLHVHGTNVKFSSLTLGGLTCTATAKIQLTAGQSHAHIDSFEVLNPHACTFNGLLATECETLTSVQSTGLPWTGTGTTPAGGAASVDITKVAIDLTLDPKAGKPNCPHILKLEDTATPNLRATFDSHQAASTAELSGQVTITELDTEFKFKKHLGNTQLSGQFHLTPAATYGIG